MEGFSASTVFGRGTDSEVGKGTETGSSGDCCSTGAGFSGLETGSGFFSWTGIANPASRVAGSAPGLARSAIGSA